MRVNTKTALVVLVTGIAAGCGSSSTPAPATPTTGFFISITNLTWSPVNLRAPPGATVTVINNDATTHSVTSEASLNAFTPGSVAGVSFDTGAFTGTKTFVLPSNASNGTVIPFYCTVHVATMIPPNGSITIDSSAQPTSPP